MRVVAAEPGVIERAMPRPSEVAEELAHLIDEVGPSAFRVAYGLLGDVADAEDAVQEAMARALAQAGRLRDPAAARGWFFRILTNFCRRSLRRRRTRRVIGRLWKDVLRARSRTAEISDAAPTADEALARLGELARVQAALGELSQRQRMAVVLRYCAELSVPEIAASMRIAPASAKTHLSRGLERLRERMGEAP
jgi:RNA polymerase sigma factor (sigma-70 family)